MATMYKIMKKHQKKVDNGGFSLVELIIVIAIMAVLIAILAPQYLQYVEKSKQSADSQSADTITSAIKVALSDDTYAGTGGGFVVTWKNVSNVGTVTVSGTDKTAIETLLNTSLGKTFSGDVITQPIKSSTNSTKTYTWTVTYTNGQPNLAVTPWA